MKGHDAIGNFYHQETFSNKARPLHFQIRRCLSFARAKIRMQYTNSGYTNTFRKCPISPLSIRRYITLYAHPRIMQSRIFVKRALMSTTAYPSFTLGTSRRIYATPESTMEFPSVGFGMLKNMCGSKAKPVRHMWNKKINRIIGERWFC